LVYNGELLGQLTMTELKHAQAMNLMANAGLTLEQLLAAHETALVFGRLNLGDLKRLRHCSRRLRWIVGEFTRGRAYVYCPPLLASWRVYALCLRAFGNDVHVRLCSVPRQPVLDRLVQLSQRAGASIDVVLRDPNLQDLARLFITSGAALGNVDIGSNWGDGHYEMRFLSAAALSKAGLCQLVKCRSLDLSGHLLVSSDCLEGLTCLKKLSLRRCQLAEIGILSSLHSLGFLDVSDNHLHDIDRLADLTGLTELSLRHCNLQVLTSLAGLTLLNTLNISGNGGLGELGEQLGVDPLAPLAGLPGLSVLGIADCKLRHADVLTVLQTLRVLNAGHNLFKRVTISSKLKELDIRDCMQLRATPGGLSELNKLSIAMPPTRLIFPVASPTIEVLRQATNLRTLNVSDTVLNPQQLELLLGDKEELCELAITGSYVGGGVCLPLAPPLTCVNFDCTDLGRALLEALVARGRPMVTLTTLRLSRQLLHIHDMAALAKALQLLPALKEIHMARSMGPDGVRTVLQHAPKATITELDLSENPFCASADLARHALAQCVEDLRAYEKNPKVKISDPDQTPYSIDGPSPYVVVGVCARPTPRLCSSSTASTCSSD
jgi:hypothetical protein